MDDRNALVEAHLHLARAAARKAARSKFFRARLGDEEDLYQWACLALLRLAEEYDAGRGMAFEHYAAVKLRYRLVDLARGRYGLVHCHQRSPVGTPVPFRILALRVEAGVTDPRQQLWEQEEDVQSLLRYLRPEQRDLLNRRFGLRGQRAWTHAELATELGVCDSCVSLREKTAVRELVEYVRRRHVEV